MYTTLREAILGGTLRPGDCLVEQDVARRCGVSRAPAREALKRLQVEGLLDAIPRRGYVVTPITVGQVQDLFDLRLILEREAAARAARRATPDDVRELERLVGDPYVPGDAESYRRFLEQNRRFHRTIASLAGNARLAAIVDSLLEELERLFHLGLDVRDRAEQLVREHRDLVTAIRSRDPETASRIMEDQIENARAMVLEAILQGVLPASVR